MSINLNKAAVYLKLLVDRDITKLQRFGLIYTANKTQISALVEIVHNILAGSVPLPKIVLKTIKRRQAILKEFSNPKNSNKKKVLLIKEHFRLFANVLFIVRDVILKLLK